jgi:hypothetical protein
MSHVRTPRWREAPAWASAGSSSVRGHVEHPRSQVRRHPGGALLEGCTLGGMEVILVQHGCG